MYTISTTWADIKTKTISKNLIQYYINRSDSSDYIILIGDSIIQYYTKIIDSDLIDFENNYKSSATLIISFGEGLSKIIT